MGIAITLLLFGISFVLHAIIMGIWYARATWGSFSIIDILVILVLLIEIGFGIGCFVGGFNELNRVMQSFVGC